MISVFMKLIPKKQYGFYQTREEYLEELAFSRNLEEILGSEEEDSMEYTSTIIESAISG